MGHMRQALTVPVSNVDDCEEEEEYESEVEVDSSEVTHLTLIHNILRVSDTT